MGASVSVATKAPDTELVVLLMVETLLGVACTAATELDLFRIDLEIVPKTSPVTKSTSLSRENFKGPLALVPTSYGDGAGSAGMAAMSQTVERVQKAEKAEMAKTAKTSERVAKVGRKSQGANGGRVSHNPYHHLQLAKQEYNSSRHVVSQDKSTICMESPSIIRP